MMNLKTFKTQKYTVGFSYEIDVKQIKVVATAPKNHLGKSEKDIISINKSKYMQYL